MHLTPISILLIAITILAACVATQDHDWLNIAHKDGNYKRAASPIIDAGI